MTSSGPAGEMGTSIAEQRLRRRDRVLASIVPVLLAVVALHQIVTAQTADLTPWKGGGFGMFATADHLDTRILHLHLRTDDRFIPVAREALEDIAPSGPGQRAHLRVRALPSQTHALAVTEILSPVFWRLEDGTAFPRAEVTGAGAKDDLDVRAVRMTVWRPTPELRSGWLIPERVSVYEMVLVEDGR